MNNDVTGSKRSPRPIIGMAAVFGPLIIAHLLFFKEIPIRNEEVAFFVLGLLFGKYGTVIDWNFGGNKLSDDKAKVEAAKELKEAETTNNVNAQT